MFSTDWALIEYLMNVWKSEIDITAYICRPTCAIWDLEFSTIVSASSNNYKSRREGAKPKIYFLKITNVEY